MMTTATTMSGRGVDSDKDNDKEPNGKDSDDLIFDKTTNLWSDAFLAKRGVISKMMTMANNNARERDLF